MAGLFIFLLFLYFFIPFNELIETIQRVNPFYFLLAFGALFASAVFYSLTWQRLLNLLSVKTSLFKALQYVLVENFINLVIPAEPISGDLSRIYLMSKETNENTGRIAASVFGHRILVTFVTIGSLIASTILFAIKQKPPSLVLEFAVIVAACGSIFIGLLVYFSLRKNAMERIVNWLINLLVRLLRGRWQSENLKKSAMNMLGAFHEGILALGEHPKGLILPLFLSILAWLLDILVAVFIFLSLGSLEVTISLSAIVIVYSISVAIQYIPVGIIPGEVGITEIVMTSLFALLGSSQAVAACAVATVLIRILTF